MELNQNLQGDFTALYKGFLQQRQFAYVLENSLHF